MGFADQFLQGLMAGRAEQERKRREAMIESERRTQTERLGRQDAQADALTKLKLWQSMPQPEQALPTGQAGPPAPLPVPEVEVPSLAPGGEAMRVRPQTMTDLLVQNRAQQDLQGQRALELERARDESRKVALPEALAAKIGVAPGLVDPQVVAAATQILNAEESRKDREAARGERAALRGEVAGQKQDAMSAAVGAYVDALREGSATTESIPTTLRGQVLAAAQKAGVRPLARKELEQVRAFQTMEGQAADLRDTFRPGAVGPLEGRLPGFTLGRESATFRAATQGLFNELGKLRSGGAITPQEYERLSAELPTVTDTETVFKAKLDRFLSSLAQKRQSILEPVNRGGGRQPAAAGGDNDPLGLGI